MRAPSASNLSSGVRYKGVINYTFYRHCVKLAKTLLLGHRDSTTDVPENTTNEMHMPLAVLLMHDPLSAEMAQAFARGIMKIVLRGESFSPTLKDELHIILDICKVWFWGHTYIDQGNTEVPGWFFRHVELFLYHTLLEVVHMIGELTDVNMTQLEMTNGKLCAAVKIVCTMAAGAAASLPAGSMHTGPVEASGALLLMNACESVEYSILNELPPTMTRGHVVLAMVMASDALNNPQRDPLGNNNLFAHLFASGTPLNFLRRAAAFSTSWKDKIPTTLIKSVESDMRKAVISLDDEIARRRRRKMVMASRAMALNPTFTTNRVRSVRTSRPLSGIDKNALTPRELFGYDTAEQDSPQTPKRKGVDESGSPNKKARPSTNEWMSKYPGITTKGYWNEESGETPGVELETVLKNALQMSGPSNSEDS